jgi:phosphotriesterase-related protein
VYLEFDQFGQESSFYSHQPHTIAIPNDAVRVNLLRSLRDRGYIEQLLIAQDICHLSSFTRWGGEGFAHILTRVLPLLAAQGFSEQEIRTITHANPARAIAFSTNI